MQPQPTRSLRRAYLEWVEQQIEAYKDTVPRFELLDLADEAIEDLRVNRRGQYQLTEVLLCDAVDRKLFKRLKLPSYRTWRAAQAAAAASSGPEQTKPS